MKKAKTVRKKVRIDPKASAKEILDALDAWGGAYGGYGHSDIHFPAENQERQNLWSVLTALRGPDNGDTEVKRKLTEVIRHAAVPQLAEACGALHTEGDLEKAFDGSKAPYAESKGILHFYRHAERALRVLLK